MSKRIVGTAGWALFLMLAQTAVLTGTAMADYSGGSGTPEDPYQIGTVDDWMALVKNEHHWGAGLYFVLTADLDFGGGTLTPIGNSWNPFIGVFDGAGRALRNGWIYLPGGGDVALFSRLGPKGVIRNLGVENFDVMGAEVVAVLVGRNLDGTVESCYATGVVVGEGQVIGGLVGANYGIVSSSYAACMVKGWNNVGGLVGENGGTVTSSYATGSVHGTQYAGGLIGMNHGAVNFSYATGLVTGSHDVGGLVGYSSSGKISDSYWNIETSGQSSSAGGEGRTTDEMTYPYAEHTYVNWDFKGVWAADADYSENCGYPYLIANVPPGHSGCMPPAEGEPPVEGEGEPPVEGEPPAEGEVELPIEGEGEPPVEGEPPAEGEVELPIEGEGEPPIEGEGEPPGLIIMPTGPLHVVKTVGDSVTFEVQVSGTSEPIYYQWKHHRSEKTFEAIIGANESAYTIASIVAEDAGEYLCEVTVGAEIQYSDIFVLTVDAGLAAHGWIGLGVCAGVTALAGMLAARRRSKRSFSERSG